MQAGANKLTGSIGRTTGVLFALSLLLAVCRWEAADAVTRGGAVNPRYDVYAVKFKVLKTYRSHCGARGTSTGFVLKLRVKHARVEGIDAYGTIDHGNAFDRYEADEFTPRSNKWTHRITFHQPVNSKDPLIGRGRIRGQAHLFDDLSGYAFPTLKFTLPEASPRTCK